MQALEWAVSYPERVVAAIPIATTARHSPQQIAFNEVGRQAIMADPDWNDGNYDGSRPPGRGLAIARMVGHITYMSDESMREKFGRRLREKEKFGYDFSVDFEVESYLRYRGNQFVGRFDANSYLYITKAEDYFDLTNGVGTLADAFAKAQARFLVISFSSDWLYPSYQSQEIVRVLRRSNRDVAYCDLPSNYGHDAFLVDVAEQSELIRGFLQEHLQGEGVMAAAGKPSSTSRSSASRWGAAISPSSASSSSRNSKVLDLGCGEGELLAWLAENKGVDRARRRDFGHQSPPAIARGVSAYQGDIDEVLADYPDHAFDYVILSQTLQETRWPLKVLSDMLRVGPRRHRCLPEFRPLARAPLAAFHRPRAQDRVCFRTSGTIPPTSTS